MVAKGNIWKWATITVDQQRTPSSAPALKTLIYNEFGKRLPLTVRQFEDMLAAEKFHCEFLRYPAPHATNVRECIYFQRGPLTNTGACFAGEDVAISISYTYPDEEKESIVTSFETRVIMGSDGAAHGSGMCLAL